MFIPVQGHHLVSVDVGAGPVLLMHDGWVASAALWWPLVERLQHSWRCLAFDHRGSGSSTFPPEAITAPALVDDVFRVLDAHHVDRAVLAGESLGALVCLQAALRDPSRVLGLVLVGGFPRQLDGGTRPDLVAAMRNDWPGYVQRFVAACLPEPDTAHLHRYAANALLPAGQEAAVRMSAAHEGSTADLVSVSVPTLVVHGSRDRIAPVAGAQELARGIPDAQLVVLDGAGHLPILSRPDDVAAAIAQWWAGRA